MNARFDPLSHVDTELLRRALHIHFGVIADVVEALAGEYNETWAITTVQGERYVAKVLHDAQSLEHRLMQADLMSHLADHEPDLPIARVISTLDGASAVQFTEGPTTFHVQLLTWLPGRMISEIPYRGPELLREIGRAAGRLVRAGEGYHHRAAIRSHLWDLRGADEQVLIHLENVTDEAQRDIARGVVQWFQREAAPRLGSLATGVVHQDLNDFNMIVSRGEDLRWHLSGVLDFGDALDTVCVAEVAIAVAYAMLGEPFPLAAARHVVAGFHEIRPLSAEEIACILPLAAARLAVNATVWTTRLAEDSSNAYAASRMSKTWPLLEKLVELDRAFAIATLRDACGLVPFEQNEAFLAWARSAEPGEAVLLVEGREVVVLEVDEDTPKHLDAIFVRSPLSPDPDLATRRRTREGPAKTLTLGTHFISSTAMTARATHDGEVRRRDSVGGRVLVANHVNEVTFFAQYSGLDEIFVDVGEAVVARGRLGVTGLRAEASRLVVTWCRDEPEVWLPEFVRPDDAHLWAQRCPDPQRFLALASVTALDDPARVTSTRTAVLAASQRAYYSEPMNLTSATGVWLRDNYGREYLDAINNVTHVGHSHPHVVAAAARQLARLNTNSRFTYSALPRYAERLAATLPEPLNVVFFTCTGSEANDLALRIARQVSGREHVVVIEGAYHGNTTAVTAISPNRYRGAGGNGPLSTTHEIPQPNQYRGPYGYDHPDAGAAYARDAGTVIAAMVDQGTPPAAVFAESFMGTAGQIPLPSDYLSGVFAAVRATGGLTVSDEVQVGVGRLGSTFWGFEGHHVVPDIVTMGKPLGNGYPLAAVVTTREIADAFDNGMKYFNTFAGSPVACAIGDAVLDVVERESLQRHAEVVGAYFRRRLVDLASTFEVVGDIRGYGLYLGVELVSDRATKAPARTLAYRVSERMKDEGVITYPNGDLDNVLKIKPPMVFTSQDADVFADTLASVLDELV